MDKLKVLIGEATSLAYSDEYRLQALICTGVCVTLISACLWKTFYNPKLQSEKDVSTIDSKDEKPVPMTLEKQLENTLLRFENEFKPRIENLLDSFDPTDEKQIYERNYCNEMLLKLLISLDGIDLVGIENPRRQVLRSERKDIIRLIQSNLKKLDSLK
ncbi:hypothetical protein KAFR_0A02690 [Kazachstania africana CBS 2517]|uniref:BAG domain-containing protein n=1 Tax=Kazachstania africana (strain ATCC 22294 / BCRC 22015 / CBS 2517 / CECT 1963 / NBRC 1671 / NRRL Y-8276) TaxID=1071382 RepID=H2AMV5_KAZAF|nr:hypothetical protein KAFR_0A02690 [Kazachstania africana CBS 2517]CCF55705.1 hypothetical protein KAFR_0A02690 [Kazachstania africana CBS 2517]